MTRRFVVARSVIAGVIAALLVGGGVTTAALLSHSTASPSSTQLRHYEPWSGGHPVADLHVVVIAGNANCWEGSLLSGRADAYRCSTDQSYDGGNLFDPCFASPANGHQFLCPNEPLGRHRVLGLASANPGPANKPTARESQLAWDLELADGVTCRAVSGAAQIVDGNRSNYVCSDKRWLWGEPDRTRPLWTIRSSPTIDSTDFSDVTIVAAWS